MAYVYRHIRLDKNTPFYIGIGSDSNYKRAHDFNRCGRNAHWQNIKSKTDIDVEIIVDGLSIVEAGEKEIEFISLYKRVCDGGTLCNITLGGAGVSGYKNPKLSERNKSGIWLGKKHKPESREKISRANKGKCFSELHRKRISDSARKKTGSLNPNYRGKIQAYKDGNLIGVYDSLLAASCALGCSTSRISDVVNGRRGHTKGYYFARLNQ